MFLIILQNFTLQNFRPLLIGLLVFMILATIAFAKEPLPNLLSCQDSFKKVVYFHEEQILDHCISVRAGRIYFQNKLLSTGERGFIFVIDALGRFVVSSDIPDKIHHSSLAGGAMVQAAGRVYVREGILLAINNHSGHYKPSRQHLELALRELERMGADTYLTVLREVI